MTSCDFSLAHYRELLEAAKSGGYRPAAFDDAPEPGDLFIRHDVDLSLQAAVELAEVEAEEGVWSTWCLMTRSSFYNLASSEGEETIARLRELGGRIAHHAVWPDIDLDERFEAVVSWHNPDLDYLTLPLEGARNAMSPTWFDPEHFRSDSNGRWGYRGHVHACPHEELAEGGAEWLHLIIHPEIWVYEGATMRETMESFLDADRARRYRNLELDRIDLS